MRNIHLLAITLIIALTINSTITRAQTPTKAATVKIAGELTNPFNLTLADMHEFEQTKVTRKDRDGKDHSYSGVVLALILQKAGATMGKDLKGENLTKYANVEASDGYQVVFALAELDKEFTDRTIILADEVDGKALPPADGPFRIIVQDEKKPARCIKQVIGITVRFAK
ncbi:molybdopterin-dependent oxidoreductase [Mucilaginibacter paludis]|uniref:Oxidoreductase molybdopterin binding n=1 Tax=Mucilaginibacter paludis DSM 18603 TaxID=714943 RepID=H1YB83_9SPHI|nr:molybdopterin-dependent oxidoreductase [Mucilaginibacter paludis]EHQ30609.1 oxidoreductase molybdopterin binding [Mucilaginibacter paludis DSM 18603]